MPDVSQAHSFGQPSIGMESGVDIIYIDGVSGRHIENLNFALVEIGKDAYSVETSARAAAEIGGYGADEAENGHVGEEFILQSEHWPSMAILGICMYRSKRASSPLRVYRDHVTGLCLSVSEISVCHSSPVTKGPWLSWVGWAERSEPQAARSRYVPGASERTLALCGQRERVSDLWLKR